MCDDLTEADNESWSARQLKRRDLGVMGAGAAVIALASACTARTGTPSATPTQTSGDIASRSVRIATSEGSADAFFVYPAKGRHAAIIMWPDVAGLRDAYRTMATRLAQSGYAVLVVNQYYRSSPAPILETMAQWRTDAGQAKLKPMIAAITPTGTTSDAAAFVTWLDRQKEVDTGKKIGSCGYCMGGPFAFRTAVVKPDRVGAICSFHGGGLATEKPDSPHLLIPKMKAAMLIAIAQNDDQRDPQAKISLRAAADAAKRPAEIEVYPAQHGWCTIDAPVYDEVQADKAWQRMLATYTQYL